MTTRRRFRPWLHIPLGLVLGSCGVLYYGFIDRPTINPIRDGWTLKFSYVRWGCRTCLGQVEQLECHDQIVSPPVLKADKKGYSKRLMIETPVGSFEAITGFKRWRWVYNQSSLEESHEEITAEELERGYYGRRLPDASGEWRNPSRKKGTPRYWCLASSFSYSFWIDPARLSELAAFDQPAPDDNEVTDAPPPITTQPAANAP